MTHLKNRLPAIAAAVTMAVLASGARAEMSCADMTARLTRLANDSATPLRTSPGGATFKSLYDDCDANDRFEGGSLPSLRNGRLLKCSTDKNRVEFVNKYASGPIVWRAKMAVDADGAPVSRGPQPTQGTNQPTTWLTFDPGSDLNYANAEELSYVVIPKKTPKGTSFQTAAGIGKGDLAVVFARGRCSFGVVGDVGPHFRLGEASLKTHEDLGNPQCAVPNQRPCTRLIAGGSGRGLASDVTYIVFPGTRPKPLLNQSAAKTAEQAAKAAVEHFLADHSAP